MKMFLQSHSIGPIKPNLVMLGWPGELQRVQPFVENLQSAYQLGMSLLIVVDRGLPQLKPRKRIDVWWRGKENGSLMIILAYLLTKNWEWAGTKIRLLRVVNDPAGKTEATDALKKSAAAARIDADVEVVVSSDKFNDILNRT